MLREIGMLRHLKHDNLLSVTSILPPLLCGEKFKDVYQVTPLMDVDLNIVLRSRQVLEENHLQYFLYQMLRGLKYLHSAKIAHRDLKPANIVTNISCELKIIDFGLSRSVEVPDNDLTDYVVTRWYRPPELLFGNTNYTTEVDIWSIGCILAEMYNRKPLFPGKSTLEQIQIITLAMGKIPLEVIEKPESQTLWKNIPDGHSISLAQLVPKMTNSHGLDILGKMLTLDPRRRPTANELLHHPYLAHLHDEKDEPLCSEPFNWPYEGITLDAVHLRAAFLKEIQVFNKDFK